MVLVIDPEAPFGAAVMRALGAGAARGVPFDPAAVARAAVGCDRIVIGGLAPDWRSWAAVIDAAVEASTENQASIVHHVGVDGLKVIYGVPLPPFAPKGEAIDQIGAEGRLANLLEDQLQQHAELNHLRVLLVRSGDVFGPGVRLGYGATTAEAAVARAALPWYGPRDLAHAFTYIDDVASLALAAIAVPDRPDFEIVNVPGHIVTAEEWAQAWGAPGVRGIPHFLVRARAWMDPRWKPLAAGLWGWAGTVMLNELPTRALLPEWNGVPLADAVGATLAAARGR